MNSRTIASKIVEGLPYQCRIEGVTDYSVMIPAEALDLHYPKLFANCLELSHHEDINCINASRYEHSGNFIYIIEVSQNYMEKMKVARARRSYN